MDLHARMREARIVAGLSQSEVARRLGVQPHTVYRYERQGLTPSVNLLAELADTLGVSLDWLVRGVGSAAEASPGTEG